MASQTIQIAPSDSGRIAAERILELLQSRDLSVNWLAAQVELTLDELFEECVRTERMTVTTWARAAAAFGITLESLLTEGRR